MKKDPVVLTKPQATALSNFLALNFNDSTQATILLVRIHLEHVAFEPLHSALNEVSLHDLIQALHYGWKFELDANEELNLLYNSYLKKVQSIATDSEYSQHLSGLIGGLEQAANLLGIILVKEKDE